MQNKENVLNSLKNAMSRFSSHQEQYLNALREKLPEDEFQAISDYFRSLSSEMSEAVEKTLELLESSKNEEKQT